MQGEPWTNKSSLKTSSCKRLKLPIFNYKPGCWAFSLPGSSDVSSVGRSGLQPLRRSPGGRSAVRPAQQCSLKAPTPGRNLDVSRVVPNWGSHRVQWFPRTSLASDEAAFFSSSSSSSRGYSCKMYVNPPPPTPPEGRGAVGLESSSAQHTSAVQSQSTFPQGGNGC